MYEEDVAPGMSTAFLRHWYVNGVAPDAVTESVAAAPAHVVTGAGPWPIEGG